MNYGQTERTETTLSNTETTVPVLFNLNDNGFVSRYDTSIITDSFTFFDFLKSKTKTENYGLTSIVIITFKKVHRIIEIFFISLGHSGHSRLYRCYHDVTFKMTAALSLYFDGFEFIMN